MSTGNPHNEGRVRLFAPEDSEEMDRLIEETEQQIVNTRLFLESLYTGDDMTRRYIDQLKGTFEKDLRRFERTREREGR